MAFRVHNFPLQATIVLMSHVEDLNQKVAFKVATLQVKAEMGLLANVVFVSEEVFCVRIGVIIYVHRGVLATIQQISFHGETAIIIGTPAVVRTVVFQVKAVYETEPLVVEALVHPLKLPISPLSIFTTVIG